MLFSLLFLKKEPSQAFSNATAWLFVLSTPHASSSQATLGSGKSVDLASVQKNPRRVQLGDDVHMLVLDDDFVDVTTNEMISGILREVTNP